MTPEARIEAHHRMLRVRTFDLAVKRMAERGELPGAVHTSLGQEAEVVGVCMALRDDDWMTGNHRSHGHPIGKGSDLGPLMAEIHGKATGVCKGKGGSMHLADFSVGSLGESGIVGTAPPIATGAGLSAKLAGRGQVALCFFGDGAAQQGVLFESWNLASIWSLPVVFVCENNMYGSTTPFAEVSSTPRVALRAEAFGMPGTTVEDGQDVEAVYAAAAAAVERARSGDGPSIVEVMTYRYSEHSEGLRHAGSYRDEAELASWRDRDPIAISERALLEQGIATDDVLREIGDQVAGEVEEAIRFALDSPWPEPETAFDDLYSEPVAVSR
jgi:pyruvate dehydrogenase E1 component alpha subunit